MPEAESEDKKLQFLTWQCLIRQYAVRNDDGRPSPGMRPVLSLPDDRYDPHPVTVLIHRENHDEVTRELRFMAQKTFDPKDRREAVLKHLSATHYQRAREFHDRMTALFALNSAFGKAIRDSGACELEFEQNNQRWRLPCSVSDLQDNEPLYQATYWHNYLFNPTMPGRVRVLCFTPDWERAQKQDI